MAPQNKKMCIGLLATGNELTEGDILNTNGQMIARQLTDNGLSVGMHVIVSDAEQVIIDGIHFLLAQHDILIITGGLGPTSDDRTRFALSAVIDKPLIFDEVSWSHIIARYKKFGIAVAPHPSNQQQALFPADAVIIPNNHGTAAGCSIIYNKKIIYMLPGPPNECLPMFKTAVLPDLLIKNDHAIKKLKWRLLGVIESEIAAQVDEAMQGYAVLTGYRIDYPYLEVKIYTEETHLMTVIENKINALFSAYILASLEKTAVETLQEAIINCRQSIIIEDYATHGQLQAQLINPTTYPKVSFTKIDAAGKQAITILINGLQEFWQGQSPNGQTSLNLQLKYQALTDNVNITIPFRNPHVVKYAIEYIARACLDFLQKLPGA